MKTLRISTALLVVSLISVQAFAATDPCAAAASRKAAAMLRTDSDFLNYDSTGNEKATIHQINTSKNEDGTYDVEVAFGLPQEDDGETQVAEYSVNTQIHGAECIAVSAERTE